MIIEKIVIQANQPNSNNVLWGKPMTGGLALYAYNNGKWLPVKSVDDNGTISTDDDVLGGDSKELKDAVTTLQDNVASIQIDYTAKVNGLNNSIEQVNSSINEMQNSLSTTQSDITAANTSIQENTDSISAAKKRIDTIEENGITYRVIKTL